MNIDTSLFYAIPRHKIPLRNYFQMEHLTSDILQSPIQRQLPMFTHTHATCLWEKLQ
jgi:hypothetical protein